MPQLPGIESLGDIQLPPKGPSQTVYALFEDKAEPTSAVRDLHLAGIYAREKDVLEAARKLGDQGKYYYIEGQVPYYA